MVRENCNTATLQQNVELEKNFEKKLQKIREPQWGCCNFAAEMSEERRVKNLSHVFQSKATSGKIVKNAIRRTAHRQRY